NPDGTFRIDSINGSEQFEDVQAIWFDTDGDQDLDLYVVSGGADGAMSRANFQDRIYLNDGKGYLTLQQDALPTISNTNCVTAGDYDGDGDIDLFVGGAAKPGSYPFSERSYLLENRSGKFHDITKNLPGMTDLGLVHSALWSDYNQDGLQDLILVGEWSSPRIFKQEAGRFSEQTKTAGLAEYTGWWNTIIEADIDRDGDPDYIAGNLGLNQRYDASLETPLMIDAKDFDENGAVDPVLSYYIQGKAYPAHPKAALIKQMAGLRKFYLHYDDYARADYQDFMSILRPEGKFHGEAKHLASSLIINRGDGSFEVKALPLEAQFSPIESILFYDINHDGFEDIIAAGNRYSAETNGGWYDASLGVILSGDGKGNFTPVPAYQSGFSSRQDARSLDILPIGAEGKPMLIQGNNNSPVECWEIVQNDS
ncbi:MAG: VCBS repeat-containing protein, partial [Bacteroidetes bacterium]|nr:VCBS repeat-containing protein [Bacteroidota bacterium]